MKSINVYAANSTATSSLKFDVEVPQKEASPRSFSCAVRVLLQNWRQGTVATKSRGEVNFSNVKPWKQKGTGRARAGTKRSPIWRKGGNSFGPQPRTRMLGLNAKTKGLVFNNLFYTALNSDSISCLDLSFENAPQTKLAQQALKSAGLTAKKVVVLMAADDLLSYASFRNIANVHILFFDQPNAFDLAGGTNWVFLKKDWDTFKHMVAQWS